jgi:glycosyltransferase involved in cell wall biosynthesis
VKIILFANTPWYLYNYCFPLADAIKQLGMDILLVSPKGEYADRLVSAGFRHVSFSLQRRSINPITEIWSLIKLLRLYKREKPDIVHHFTTKCIIYGSVAAHRSGIEHVVNSVTGMGYAFSGEQWFRRFLRIIIKSLYRRTLVDTKVLFQNPNDRDEFINEGLVLPEQTILIRSSGVNLEKFNRTPEPDGVPFIILAGRLLYDKGVVEFVEAARMLKMRNIPARFALVGEPDPDNPSSIPLDKLKSWHEEGVVEWLGWQEDMALVYKQANIVCLPSYREGVPKSLIEAAAVGRAIVTTDTPGCRDVVQNGINGFLVPVRSTKELADALQVLILDKTLRQKMGQEGHLIAERDFNLQNVLASILAVYGKKADKS